MIRAGWLEHGPGKHTEGRGGEPFVPVSWETALGLVADEVKRVKTEHGNESISRVHTAGRARAASIMRKLS